MTLEDMIRIKDERGLSFSDLSRYSGVPKITIQKIFSGATKHPRKPTLDALEKVLSGSESIYHGRTYEYELRSQQAQPSMVRESSAVYTYSHDDSPENSINKDAHLPAGRADYNYKGSSPEQVKCARQQALSYVNACREASMFDGNVKDGELYTIDDYYALPDERRVELINGVIYDMSSPSFAHQIIGGEVHTQLKNQIKGKGGSCIPMISPVDVKLSDEFTMVQPDVLILCDRNKIRRWGIEGAPDFILEVLSPSTAKKDMSLKYMKYYTAGVREYWLIDPDKRTLIVYNFMDESMIPKILPLKGKLGLAIYDGQICIDLDEVANELDTYARF